MVNMPETIDYENQIIQHPHPHSHIFTLTLTFFRDFYFRSKLRSLVETDDFYS